MAACLVGCFGVAFARKHGTDYWPLSAFNLYDAYLEDDEIAYDCLDLVPFGHAEGTDTAGKRARGRDRTGGRQAGGKGVGGTSTDGAGAQLVSLDLAVLASSGLTRSFGTFREAMRCDGGADEAFYLRSFLPAALAAEGHASRFAAVRIVRRRVRLLPDGDFDLPPDQFLGEVRWDEEKQQEAAPRVKGPRRRRRSRSRS